MTNLSRKTAKIFGETASTTGIDPEIGQFGSAKAGTYVGTNDIDTIQSLPAWSNGWIDAVTPTQQFPTLPEMTGVHNVLSYQEAYLLQKGVAEWDSDTTYYTNDYCRVNDTIYYSLQDNNTNHNPSTAKDYWIRLDEKYLNYEQVSNCAIRIPQRINLIDNDNLTVTLKAGSIITVPYGTTDLSSSYTVGDTFINANFKVVDTDWNADDNLFFVHAEVQADITSIATTANQVSPSSVTVNLTDNTIHPYAVPSNSQSGSTSPSFQTGCYYNTSTNKAIYYSSGSAKTDVISLPVAITYSNAAGTYAMDKIVYVCNGFGFIGSTIWVDTGVIALIPNGRNADGTLNNTKITTAHIKINHNPSASYSRYCSAFTLNENGAPQAVRAYFQTEIKPQPDFLDASNSFVWYNPIENLTYYKANSNTDMVLSPRCWVGNMVWDYDNGDEFTAIDVKPFKVANEADIDGQWISSFLTIASSVEFNTTAQEKTYSLEGYLPNDGNAYEVLFLLGGQSAAANAASFSFSIRTDISNGNVQLCRAISRSTAYVTACSSCIIPLKNRTITVRQGNNTSTGKPIMTGLHAFCYRKVR